MVGRTSWVWANPESSLGSHGNDDYRLLGSVPTSEIRAAWKQSKIIWDCVRARGPVLHVQGAGVWDVRTVFVHLV